jgi:chaperonin GroES
MKQFKPLGDRVLIKPIKQEETKTKSGIIISDSMTQSQKVNGEVIEIGTGIFSQSGEKIPMTVKVGDIVLYEKGQGTNEIKIDDEKYLLFNEHQLIGIVSKVIQIDDL